MHMSQVRTMNKVWSVSEVTPGTQKLVHWAKRWVYVTCNTFSKYSIHIYMHGVTDNLPMFLRVSVLLLILVINSFFPHMNHRDIYLSEFCLISCAPVLGREKLKGSKIITAPERMKLPHIVRWLTPICSHKHKGLKAMGQVTMLCQSHEPFELSQINNQYVQRTGLGF